MEIIDTSAIFAIDAAGNKLIIQGKAETGEELWLAAYESTLIDTEDWDITITQFTSMENTEALAEYEYVLLDGNNNIVTFLESQRSIAITANEIFSLKTRARLSEELPAGDYYIGLIEKSATQPSNVVNQKEVN